jgi:hypothetical protein
MRGYAAWLATKVSVIIFAAAIFSAFLAFLAFEGNFEAVDGLAKKAEGLSQAIDALAASPGAAEVFLDIDGVDSLKTNASRRYITLVSGANSADRAVVTNLTDGTIASPQRIRLNYSNGIVEISKVS